MGSDVDIVALVEADHRAVRTMLARLSAAGGDERAALWPDLLRALAVHEVAEELVVFPAVRAVAQELGPVLDQRIDEQTAAEELLARMEEMDPASSDFGADLARLEEAVRSHAAAEEADVLPVIVRHDEALDRPGLGARYEASKRRAPTRPHPGAPHRPPGNVLAGPVVSFVDRVRDHLR